MQARAFYPVHSAGSVVRISSQPCCGTASTGKPDCHGLASRMGIRTQIEVPTAAPGHSREPANGTRSQDRLRVGVRVIWISVVPVVNPLAVVFRAVRQVPHLGTWVALARESYWYCVCSPMA